MSLVSSVSPDIFRDSTSIYITTTPFPIVMTCQHQQPEQYMKYGLLLNTNKENMLAKHCPNLVPLDLSQLRCFAKVFDSVGLRWLPTIEQHSNSSDGKAGFGKIVISLLGP
jgi:hypothetical protein